jgi:hypothetical protein
MQSSNRAASKRRHLSRHERQRQARAAAFSRRSRTTPLLRMPVKLTTEELELTDRLVRRDRTAVSTALLVIAGIGAGDAARRAVLQRVGEAACSAEAAGAISKRRGEQIARHVARRLQQADVPVAA